MSFVCSQSQAMLLTLLVVIQAFLPVNRDLGQSGSLCLSHYCLDHGEVLTQSGVPHMLHRGFDGSLTAVRPWKRPFLTIFIDPLLVEIHE